MKIDQQVSAWLAAGIIDAETADRLRAFEAGQRTERGVSVAEVLAYIGAVVVLVGVGFFVGVEYSFLGGIGRSLVVGLVGLAAGAAGLALERQALSGPGRRARAAAYFLLVPALFYLVVEIGNDLGPQRLTNPAPLVFLVAGAAGALLALPLLFHTRAWPLALALALCACAAAGAFVGYRQLAGWPAELAWLLAGVMLAATAELFRRRGGGVSTEVLRFAALVPPLVAALVLSADFAGGTPGLELFAAVLALAAFGLAVARASSGYAIAGGLGLFIVVNEVGFRHFASQVGFPVVLIVSGLALLGIAGALVRLLPRLRGRPAPADGPEPAGV